MIHIREVIVVEGRYDAARLRSVTDALIVETDGFHIFHDPERLALLRRLAKTRGLLILTDSDSAGFVIRDHLSGAIPAAQIRHAYIPPVTGKERRKAAPSREGLLGVEGMDTATLERVLTESGATLGDKAAPAEPVPMTKADLYALGLSGGADSAARRRMLQKELELPEHLSANALLQALNLLFTREEFLRTAGSAAWAQQAVRTDTPDAEQRNIL